MEKFHIEANNSTVVVGCSGDTVIQSGAQTNELETELLRVFRRLTVRERVELMRIVYEFEDRAKKPGKQKKPLARNGQGEK